jgi:hypothetical protein
MDPMRPAEAQRVTVFGSTLNISATSPGVSNRSGISMRRDATGPEWQLQQITCSWTDVVETHSCQRYLLSVGFTKPIRSGGPTAVRKLGQHG